MSDEFSETMLADIRSMLLVAPGVTDRQEDVVIPAALWTTDHLLNVARGLRDSRGGYWASDLMAMLDKTDLGLEEVMTMLERLWRESDDDTRLGISWFIQERYIWPSIDKPRLNRFDQDGMSITSKSVLQALMQFPQDQTWAQWMMAVIDALPAHQKEVVLRQMQWILESMDSSPYVQQRARTFLDDYYADYPQDNSETSEAVGGIRLSLDAQTINFDPQQAPVWMGAGQRFTSPVVQIQILK
jgi:hypothetical protein